MQRQTGRDGRTDETHFIADETGARVENPNYQKPRAYQPPAMLRLGFEIGY